MSVENDYPIVPVGLVGGDDVYRSLTTREGLWGRLSQGLTEKLSGRTDMAIPLMHGIGPTLIPRPQRMYLRFGAPIDTTKPARVSEEKWVATVKQNTHESLEQALADLLVVRSSDPYRELNPLAWRTATRSPAELKGGVNHGSHIRLGIQAPRSCMWPPDLSATAPARSLNS